MPCKEKHFQHSNIFKQVLPVTTKLTRYTHNKPRPIPSQQNSHHTHHRHSLDGVTSSLLNITHPAGSCHVWSEHHYNLGRSTRTTFYPLTALVCLHSLLHSYLWKQAIWYKVVCHGRFRSSKLVPIESQYAISYLSSIIIRNLGCFPCI